MFGKLTLEAIPYHDPIIMGAVGAMILGGLALVAALTYFGKWKWLWTEWLTSVDHKKIGIMYIIVAMLMLLRGFADAIMMRMHMAAVSAGTEGFLPPHHYDQIFTAHGVIMIFFMAMPFMVGLMNIVVPLQIGARVVAYPFLLSLFFWLFVVGVALMNISLGVGEFAQTGWLAYPPLSGKQFSPGVGVDYWIWSLQISGIGTLLTGVNFFVTILKMRAPGLKMMQMPVFTWTALCTNVLIIISFPILTATVALLTLDRYLGTHFFTNEMGGNQMRYVNLIWAWGHPEVYILILPAFGIFSEVVATFCKKRLFGYTSLVWATAAITILSFIVWLHHFFTMGAGANVNAFFGIATMIISIPTGVKIFNWLFTMYRGRIQFSVPILWTLGFLVTFTLGGMTGVLLAVPGADFVLHNSLFLIAHFHNVIIGGAVFGYLARFNYWFPKAFGFTLNERLGRYSFGFWITGFFFAFVPLYILGFMGMTRRVSNQIDPQYHLLLAIAAGGAVLILIGIICQLLQLAVSVKDRDAFWAAKEDGSAFLQPAHYAPIHMPKNTSAGLIISAFSLAMGFALVWHIWWLAIVGLVGMIATYIKHTFNDDVDYYVPVEVVERLDNEHFAAIAKAGVNHGR